MNLKLSFAFSTAFTCLAPNIFVASAVQSGVVADREDDSQHLRGHIADTKFIASTFPDSVSTANENRLLRHADKKMRLLAEPKAISAIGDNKSPCKDSPLEILLETTGGSGIPFTCKSLMKHNNAHVWCSQTGVLGSHCPKVCGKCPLYGCSDSQGTFLMENGCDRDCSWLQGSSARRKRIECEKPSVAETCRATCNLCDPSDDTESHQPSTESSSSLPPSTIPSSGPSLVSTNVPSVQLSNAPSPSPTPSPTPSRELSTLPSGQLSHQPSAELSTVPSTVPSLGPSVSTNAPSVHLSNTPSRELSTLPSGQLSHQPSAELSTVPSTVPSLGPSVSTNAPSVHLSNTPSRELSTLPSGQLSHQPSAELSTVPSTVPSLGPSVSTNAPSVHLSNTPSRELSTLPSGQLSHQPSAELSTVPSTVPSLGPSVSTNAPSVHLSNTPSRELSTVPSPIPTLVASKLPTSIPTTLPSVIPSASPSRAPSADPSSPPSIEPTSKPSMTPSVQCAERASKRFFHKTSKQNKPVIRDCGWLQAKDNKLSICADYTVGGNGSAGTYFSPAREVCRKTCRTCDLTLAPSSIPSARPSWKPTASTVPSTLPSSSIDWQQVHNRIVGDVNGDRFGSAIAMSSDGVRIVVGAYGNASNRGKVTVFYDDGSSWVPVHDSILGENVGQSVGISANGKRIIVGSKNQSTNNGTGSGQISVYQDDELSSWVKVNSSISGKAALDRFGSKVGMSDDGSRIIVAAVLSDGVAPGTDSGEVAIYQDDQAGSWVLVNAMIPGQAHQDRFGVSIGISADGSRIVVSAPYSDAGGYTDTGEVAVYEDNVLNSSWTLVHKRIPGKAENNYFGFSVDISSNGARIVVGAFYHDSNGLTNNGEVTVYHDDESDWVPVHGSISGLASNDHLGRQVKISADGYRIVVDGALPGNTDADDSGKVRVFDDNMSEWEQVGDDLNGEESNDYFGKNLGMNDSGKRIVVGAPSDDSKPGEVRVFEK